MNIIEALRVYNVHSPKLRLGQANDGGYIVNDILLQNSTRLVTAGIGGDDGFEGMWYAKTKTPVEMYDGSHPCSSMCVSYPDKINKEIFYIRQNIGYEEGNIPLNVIIDGKKNALLKVDIEGAEYNIFDNVNLTDVSGLILEVHELNAGHRLDKLIKMITETFSSLLLFHVHGNNWGGTHTLPISGTGIRSLPIENFPFVMELSFINKALVSNFELETGSFPVPGLDNVNRAGEPDIDLYWVNSL